MWTFACRLPSKVLFYDLESGKGFVRLKLQLNKIAPIDKRASSLLEEVGLKRNQSGLGSRTVLEALHFALCCSTLQKIAFSRPLAHVSGALA